MELSRLLPHTERSFFLFGPRGVGKSTWLRKTYSQALWFNLLRQHEVLQLQQDPDSFRKKIEALAPGSWIVVDEIQRFPALLDEIHDVIATHGTKYSFALSGSSARKLKRKGINFLAGRAVSRQCHPITLEELRRSGVPWQVDDLLRYGMLPSIFQERDAAGKIDYLESYSNTYIREEIKEEALVRNLEPFARFLKVVALNQGQVLNFEGVGREIGRNRTTVQKYYEVLEDTLVGVRVPAHQARLKTKEVSHPKFYFFDTGVSRVLCSRHRSELDRLERGVLFETLVLNELRAWNSYGQKGFEIRYWGTPSGGEIDFLLCYGNEVRIAVEAKSAERYRPEHSKYLKELKQVYPKVQSWVILPETTAMMDDSVRVRSLQDLYNDLEESVRAGR